MVRSFAAGLAVLVGLAGTASAADLPSGGAAGPAFATPFIAWSGFYAGANAGYGFSTGAHRPACAAPGGGACTALPALDVATDGFVGGGGFGYNQQIGRFLAGIEADIQYTDLNRTVTLTGVAPVAGGAPAAQYSATQSLDYLGTVRARMGYIANRLLVFGTGGFAYGDVQVRQTVATGGATFTAARQMTGLGYAAGAGLEYAVTSNVTAKAEALYYDLGTSRTAAGSVPATGTVRGARFETEGVVARAGLNYKFDLF
ncbi:MAG: hypothetical protein JWR08_2149 [Enterovirga sp.]|nr:hypothetical protein [Enterovirga sp.]